MHAHLQFLCMYILKQITFITCEKAYSVTYQPYNLGSLAEK